MEYCTLAYLDSIFLVHLFSTFFIPLYPLKYLQLAYHTDITNYIPQPLLKNKNDSLSVFENKLFAICKL